MPVTVHQTESPSEHALERLIERYLHEPSAELAATLRAALTQSRGAPRDALPPHVLKDALEQSPLAVSITDLNAKILYANRCFTEVTGYSQEEIVGHNESLLSYKSTPRAIYRELWQTIQAGHRWSGKLVNRRKDGARYLAAVTISPVFDTQGAMTHFLGIHRDVTEWFALERKVCNQKAFIESVVDSTPAVMAVLDESMKVVLDNQAYKKLITDMDQPEPLVHLFEQLRSRVGDFESMRAAQRSFYNCEIACKLATGEQRWFACSGTWSCELVSDVDTFFSEKRVPYLLFLAHDITSQKQQQERIRSNAMRALLAEEGMNQSLQETLSGAVYQFESPFNMLNAAMDMLERRSDKSAMDDALLSVLAEVQEQARGALHNLQQAIPREEGFEPVSLNLNQVIHDVLMIYTERLLSEGIVIDWKPTASVKPVFGEANRLRNMIKHLLDNAIEAIVAGDCRRREITIETANEDKWVSVTLIDSGGGIPEPLRIKVFEPFFSTKTGGDASHAGMGLTLAQDVINRHAGTLEIDAHFHHGCRINVRLPVSHS
ncbi:MAG: nitrogen fixation negative regulator NifL [Pseudomonadota bacterium]